MRLLNRGARLARWADEAAAAMAEMMLRMLGVPADEALDIAARPLPAHD